MMIEVTVREIGIAGIGVDRRGIGMGGGEREVVDEMVGGIRGIREVVEVERLREVGIAIAIGRGIEMAEQTGEVGEIEIEVSTRQQYAG